MSAEEGVASRKAERLRALAALKSQLCYCSACASPLKFRSFTAHPCFKEAVARLGKWRARQVIRRLSTPPSTPSTSTSPPQLVELPPYDEALENESSGDPNRSLRKRKRSPSASEVERRVAARKDDGEPSGIVPTTAESALRDDLDDFGAI